MCFLLAGIISERGDDEEGEPPEDMFAFDDDAPFPVEATAGDEDGSVANEAPGGQIAPVISTPTLPADITPLERARALAMSLGINKATPAAPTTTPPVQSSGLPPPPITADGKIDTRAALHRAKMIAMQMSGGGAAGGGGTETGMHSMEELEINDYPPQVR